MIAEVPGQRRRRRHRAEPPPRAYGKPIAAIALAGATVAAGGTSAAASPVPATLGPRTGQLTAVTATPAVDPAQDAEPASYEITIQAAATDPATPDDQATPGTAGAGAATAGAAGAGAATPLAVQPFLVTPAPADAASDASTSGQDTIPAASTPDTSAAAAGGTMGTTTPGWSAWQSSVRASPALAVTSDSGGTSLTTDNVATTTSRVLALGSAGRRVLAWQQSLSSWRTGHGRSPLTADATFGQQTRSATIDFQQAVGLAADGVVGAATAAAMSGGSAATPSAAAPAPAPAASAAAVTGQVVAATSKKYLGTPYRYGGASPSGFDCAGFTQYVYGKVGVALPRTSAAQAGAGTGVPASQARTGDLVVFWSGSSAYHVGIYLGAGQMIAAPKTGDHVKIESVFSSDVTYRRLV